MKRKKTLLLVLCVALTLLWGMMATACSQSQDTPAEEAPAEETPAEETPAEETPPAEETDTADSGTKNIGIYADANGVYYDQLANVFIAAGEQDPECDWKVEYKLGQGTAEDQISAVENFITAGYDAMIIIQNNPDTTAECLEKAAAAGIPYFGACHYFGQLDNASLSAGSTNYNFIEAGKMAGEDALAHGVTKVVMIEGVLGQGSASDQSLGFVQAYEDAGKSLGEKEDGSKWTAEEIATEKPGADLIKGSPDLVIVQWASGEWVSEPSQAAMANAITALGQDGWDGAYVHNNAMMEGAMMAVSDAGLSTDEYWLGSCNGRDISWQWVKDKKITMDVNQPANMEGCLLYQMVKAYFKGEDYRKHVHPYLTPYNQENIADLEASLVPCDNADDFMAGMNANTFVWDINDPKFKDIEGNY
ncbi:MAG: sugar ABC transporter substrate-binding protein [Clostridiales Family XIII bacterium]|jgi:ABC-type sugar transport system substrate-binding protein|nr:sugar ABC transporter substrate-binding protein [Clostridiales Family XIII bacterium]